MRPHLQEATDKLEKEQLAIDKAVAAGAYHSKRRDQAISNLIKLAASEEFKRRVSEQGAWRTLLLSNWAGGRSVYQTATQFLSRRGGREAMSQSGVC